MIDQQPQPKTSVIEWVVEFCRTVQGRSGTISVDIYMLRRANPQTIITFSVPHGERQLPQMFMDAMNKYVGYETDVASKLSHIFHGPWILNSRTGERELHLAASLLKPLQTILSTAIAQKSMLEHELAQLRASHDKLQRAYLIADQQILRLSDPAQPRDEALENHPDLFEPPSQQYQPRFII